MLIHHFVADEYVKNVFQIDLEKLKAFSIKTKVMKDKVAINKDIKIINEKIKNLI